MRWGWMVVLLTACGGGTAGLGDAAVSTDAGVRDAIAFEACSSICLRPGDCQIAYADDGFCPAGFRCATRFVCGD